jgi:hypothetical protein
MEDQKVQTLISSWQSVHDLTSPSLTLLQSGELNQTFAELSLVSGRKEYWELFVCLMGYADKTNEDPNKVLKTLAETTSSPDQTEPSSGFEEYWNSFSTLPSHVIAPTASTISLSIARDGLSIGPQRLSVFEVCWKLHKGDIKKILECMRNTQGG